MPDWRGPDKSGRIWRGAICISCLVHFCLVVAVWLLVSYSDRISQRYQSISVSLSSLQLPSSIQEKSRPQTVLEPPPRISSVTAPVAPPDPQEIETPSVEIKKTAKKPVQKRHPQPLVKAAVVDVVQPERQAFSAVTPAEITVVDVPSRQEEVLSSQSPELVSPISRPTSAAVSTGTASLVTDTEQTAIRADYLTLLRERIERHKKYPLLARKSRRQGIVVVEFELTTGGELKSCLIRESCGHRLLDRAALQAVKSAAPFPEIPHQLKTVVSNFVVPVRFVLAR